MNIRESVLRIIKASAALANVKLVDPLGDETVLLQSGLDSLGFAAVVAQLEEELGFDPFAMHSSATYPRTLGEFIAFYECAVGESR